jgi:hypothetical protein
VAAETWTWSTTFDSSELSSVMSSKAVQLRLDGLDTFASVQLNGQTVLTADNFHRFVLTSAGFSPGGGACKHVLMAQLLASACGCSLGLTYTQVAAATACLPVWPVWSGDCHTHLSQHIVPLCCCCTVVLQALVCPCEAAACAGDQQAQHHNTASNSRVCQPEVRLQVPE